jgi:hypothetical protein
MLDLGYHSVTKWIKASKHPGVVAKLAKRAQDGRTHFSLQAEKFIQKVFSAVL